MAAAEIAYEIGSKDRFYSVLDGKTGEEQALSAHA